FLLPTSSPSEHCQVEQSGSLAYTPSSKEISPAEFPKLKIIKALPPHDYLCDLMMKRSMKIKKGKFKKKKK
ncbi:RBP1A protein, partial [Anthoscopus minutus]|nr:RBP1A protein [Anthoscopus minutus]